MAAWRLDLTLSLSFCYVTNERQKKRVEEEQRKFNFAHDLDQMMRMTLSRLNKWPNQDGACRYEALEYERRTRERNSEQRMLYYLINGNTLAPEITGLDLDWIIG